MIALERRSEAGLALPTLSAVVTAPQLLLETGSLPEFVLAPDLEAGEPPEARGLARDEVRLMVSFRSEDRILHTNFREIPRFLDPGDVLVINTSGTMPAALEAKRANGMPLEIHLSTRLSAERWTIELRSLEGDKNEPFYWARVGEVINLPAGATATLLAPYPGGQETHPDRVRLWTAFLDLPCPVLAYLTEYGFPIRYGYVERPWPLEHYQTVYATEIGSAEMPSAGRAFTPELITELVTRGVRVVPLLLHTGVASLEAHEPPYEEFYRVPHVTAEAVNSARVEGHRVIAVGTTAVRALETVTNNQGIVRSGQGWTDLIITPNRKPRVVTGLLTGLHEPKASHLFMLEAMTGRERLAQAYDEALRERYLWHEFGDLHLILP